MRHKKLSSTETLFINGIRELETQLYGDQLDPGDGCRMKSDGYSWHYRPSHQLETGLLSEEEISMLKQPEKKILSIGASPAYFERLLFELCVPAKNIVVADKDLFPAADTMPMKTLTFDLTEPWPELGLFDFILFPESLCIALSNKLDQMDLQSDAKFPRDDAEKKLLADVLVQALVHLKPGGVIRANGPQSHPNVVRAAAGVLEQRAHPATINYQRYFLDVRPSGTTTSRVIMA